MWNTVCIKTAAKAHEIHAKNFIQQTWNTWSYGRQVNIPTSQAKTKTFKRHIRAATENGLLSLYNCVKKGTKMKRKIQKNVPDQWISTM